MRPVAPLGANAVFRIAGDPDPERGVNARIGPAAGADGLVERGDPSYHLSYVLTTWEPSPEERAALGSGGVVELLILGTGGHFPPTSMAVAKPPELGEGFIWIAFPPETARDTLAITTLTLNRSPASADTDIAAAARVRLERLREALEEGLGAIDPPEPPQ